MNMTEHVHEMASAYLKGLDHAILAVGRIQADESDWTFIGDGCKRLPNNDESPLFEIGSITKLFTAAVLASMVHDGKVALQTSVAELIPNKGKDNKYLQRVTLLHLATHTSGLPRLAADMKPRNKLDPYADYVREAMFDHVSGLHREDRLGAFEYSNLGYALLGELLSTVSNISYEELVRRYVWEPLQMQDTGIELNDALRTRLVPGYASTGRKRMPTWNMAAHAGAGGIKSTAADLLRFMQAYIDPEGPLADVAGSCLALHPINGKDYRLGWQAHSFDGRAYQWHNGGTFGFSSFMAVSREERNGVVLLSNHGPFPISFLEMLVHAFKRRGKPSLDELGAQLIRRWMA